MRFYTYVYVDPTRPGRFTYGEFVSFLYEPFYVGKGTKGRMLCHLSDRHLNDETNFMKKHKLLQMKKVENCHSFVVKMVNGVENFVASYCWEPFLINLIGRLDLGNGPLTNLTDGGDGIRNFSPLSREKMRLAKLGKPSVNRGKKIGPRDPAATAKQIETARKNDSYGKRLGCKDSEETRKKKSDSHKGKVFSEEHKANLSAAQKGRKMSDEAKQNMSRARQGIKRGSYKTTTVICQHCGKEMSVKNISRHIAARHNQL